MVVSALLLLGWVIYVQWMIHSVSDNGQPAPVTADVGIVLGASLWNNVPSPALRERLEHAYQLYNEGYFSKMIVSGGMDLNGSTISEAEGMKGYLMEKGCPPGDILIEDQSRSTYENLLFSKELMERNGMKKAVIVTHTYHGARALDIAEFIGMEEPGVSTIESQVMWMPWHNVRETMAYTKWLGNKILLSVGLNP